MSAATSARNRHMRTRRARMWMGPRAHGEIDHGRVVGPLELFYDLVVVVLVAQAAHHLAEHLTWRGLGEFGAVFGIVWLAWLNGTTMHDLHGRDDVGSRLRVFAQMAVLTVIATQTEYAPSTTGRGFALSTGTLFALLALLWWWVQRRDDPQWRPITRTYVIGTGVVASVLVASSWLTDGWRVLVWGALVVGYLLLSFATAGKTTSGGQLPLTVTHSFAERFGLFVIIVLGEVFLGVVDGLSSETLDLVQILTALLALSIGFGAWWSYFDFVAQSRPRETPWATTTWVFLHLPLTVSVAASAAAMVSLVEHAADPRAPLNASLTVAVGAATVLVLVAVFTALQPGRPQGTDVGVLLVSAAGCMALGWSRPTPWLLCLSLVLVISVPWVIAVARGTVMPHDDIVTAPDPTRTNSEV